MSSNISDFQDAISAAGLAPPVVIEPGKIHRFPGKSKGYGNKAGWCLLLEDEQHGCFGDWSSGISGTWHASWVKHFSQAEKHAFALRVEEAKRNAKAERDSRHADAKERAAKIWNEATPAPDNRPYLLRKYIQVHGAKLYKGALVLPVLDFTGELFSLQFIHPDGEKRMLSGGRKQGCFIPVSYAQNPQNTQNGPVQSNFADIAQIAYGCSKIIICEGWATGCTLAEVYPNALVLAAIDAEKPATCGYDYPPLLPRHRTGGCW